MGFRRRVIRGFKFKIRPTTGEFLPIPDGPTIRVNADRRGGGGFPGIGVIRSDYHQQFVNRPLESLGP